MVTLQLIYFIMANRALLRATRHSRREAARTHFSPAGGRVARGNLPLRPSQNRTWISRFIRLLSSNHCRIQTPMTKLGWTGFPNKPEPSYRTTFSAQALILALCPSDKMIIQMEQNPSQNVYPKLAIVVYPPLHTWTGHLGYIFKTQILPLRQSPWVHCLPDTFGGFPAYCRGKTHHPVPTEASCRPGSKCKSQKVKTDLRIVPLKITALTKYDLEGLGGRPSISN